MGRLRPPSLESLFVATYALLGLRIGTLPIGDNSAFVHIRTGIDIVGGRGIPRVDPYSFTALGEPWVVQSWFPSVVYGMAHLVGGLAGIVVLNGLLMTGLAWLVAKLARTGSGVRTLAAAGLAIGTGISYWSPRPLMIGLLALALLVLVVERGASPLWLVPLGWVWVNSHGSFVLGAAWLALRVAGEVLDARSISAIRHRTKTIVAILFGVALGGINPVGPRIVAFPLGLATRRDVFAEVAEWQSPDFHGALAFTSLVFLSGALVALIRRRMPWADVVPIVVLAAGGLYAQRTIPALAVALAPALGRSLRPDAEPAAVAAPRVHVAIAAVLVVLAGVFVGGALASEPLDLEGYPTRAVAALEREGLRRLDHKLAHSDVVGGLLILRYGRDADVFIDDRVDMYPREVVDDYLTLVNGSARAEQVLREHGVDLVLWERRLPLASLLAENPTWAVVHRDDVWVVFTRRAS